MKRPPIDDDASHYACDIIQNILSRLPFKSLLRFKAVCKSWKATIDDPGFAKIHSNQSIISNSQSFCLLGRSRSARYELVKFQGQDFYVQSVVESPSTEFKLGDVLCCCEGILLFRCSFREEKDMYMLLNLFTRNYSTISSLMDDVILDLGWVSYGLCFDKYEDDYKVIVLSGNGKYLVYSIKNVTWTERRIEFRGFVHGDQGTCADGVVYWVFTICFPDSSSCKEIMYFDPKDDLLKKLHKPADLEQECTNIYLTTLRGDLCLYALDRELIMIWLLKESGTGRKCWMKLMTVRNNELQESWWKCCRSNFCHKPVYLTRKNEVVFYDCCRRYCDVYCLEKQKFVEPKEFPSWTVVFPCLESLNFPTMIA